MSCELPLILPFTKIMWYELLAMCIVTDELPFEFRALELALELTCTSLDSQVCSIVLAEAAMLFNKLRIIL